MQTRTLIFNGRLNFMLVGLMAGLFFAAIIAPNALAADGDLDSTFNIAPTLNGTVREMALQPDGKILIGGTFGMGGFGNLGTQFDYSRVNSNGSLDTTFFTGLTMSVKKYLVLADGKIIVGGPGQNNNNSTLIDVTRRNANATYDTSFFNVIFDNYGIQNYIEDMALQTDGKIFVVGSFGGANSTPRTSIMRLGTNGLLDNTFINPTFTFSTNPDAHRLRRVIVQPDGKILIGGGITQVNGVNRNLIARLNADGSLDTTFTPNPDGLILTDMVLQPDGKILVSRSPTVVQGNPVPANIARLNFDGSLDSSFTTTAEQVLIQAIALQTDGKILVGGTFSTYKGAARNGVARLNTTGTLDGTFVPNVPVAIRPNKLVVQPDGKILASIDQPFNNSYDVIRFKGTFVQTPLPNRIADFDGDGRADFSVFRAGTWFVNPSSNPSFAPTASYQIQWGLSSDKLAPADFDGDGKTDIAVWREAEGKFYILNSLNNSVRIENFGLSGDVLMVGDWDGDGKADPATYREGAQSYFYYRGSLNNPAGNVTYLPWGTSGDKSVRGDFDGDGKLDTAIYRGANQTWFIRNSSNGQASYAVFGLTTDTRISGDFDGDGKTDISVFRNGLWYVLQSSNNQVRYQNWGLNTDSLVPADYDGDGKTDFAVWRNGVYYILNSATAAITYQNFGTGGDSPIASAYVQ